jgi:hypothetical protein
VHPAAHFGAEGELERQIKRIQDEAIAHGREIGLREAAEICNNVTMETGPITCRNLILSAINKKDEQ